MDNEEILTEWEVAGEPDDPLEAESVQKAIAVSRVNGKTLAVGDESKEGEWIRMEQ